MRIINIFAGVMAIMGLNFSLHSTPIEVFSEGTCQIDGIKYVAVGFGTFPLKNETCFAAVEIASECGYQIIDTATYYENFDPIEMNPFYYDPELLTFCKNHNIAVQAWGPLGRGRINDDALLTDLGMKYKKTSSQIAIKWIIQNGCIPLPGSKNPKHIKENIDVLDFVLTDEEMNLINERARKGQRERVTLDMGASFADEFDYSYEECWPKQSH